MTYTEIMTSLRLDLGKDALSTNDTARLTHWLNEALADVWATPEHIIWPWCVEVFTKTLASYKTPRSGINDADVWTVWSEDPRPLFSAGEAVKCYALPAVYDGDDLRVQASAATSEVVIFTRADVPAFSVGGANTDVIPDVLAPWVKADIRVRMMDCNLMSHAEQTLAKAYARREDEMNALLAKADSTLMHSPWLSIDQWRQALEPHY